MVQRKSETIYDRIVHLKSVKKYILNDLGDSEQTRPALQKIEIELKKLGKDVLHAITI